MKYRVSSDINSIEITSWQNFATRHSRGNIFQTFEMVEVYLNTKNSEPLVVVCFDEFDTILGILVAVVQKEYSRIFGKLTARAIVLGGPVVNDNNSEVALLIIEEFNRLCRHKVVYSQFRNLWNVNAYSEAFTKTGYVFEEHLDILFDLKKGKDELWKEIHPTRRKQINRGLKREVKTKVSELLQPGELAECYAILRSVYKEAKLPFPPLAYFGNAISSFTKKGYFRAVLAEYNNEIIGFRFFLSYNKLLYDWYAGSKSEHYDKYPNDILPWEILKWGAENGYETFDFGGAGKPDIPYGVREYKLKFGGMLVNFGRYEKIHKPLLMAVAKMGFKFWKLFK